MVTLLAVGRLKAGPERDLFDRYWTRLKPLVGSLGFSEPRLIELRESNARQPVQRKAEEAKALLERVEPGSFLIALDERGKALTTPDFSTRLADLKDSGRAIACVIGGPDGLDASVRQRADMTLSFGAMTVPHQIVRVLVAEQLYRCATVLAGHPYHRA